jgi:hypothetical protein
MRTVTRIVLLGLFAAFVTVTALPALAAESTDEDDATTATTEVVDFEYMPAVVVEPPPPDPGDQPWTTKFLVPTGLALAAVAVFVTVIQYFVRVVRSRYKVVE